MTNHDHPFGNQDEPIELPPVRWTPFRWWRDLLAWLRGAKTQGGQS